MHSRIFQIEKEAITEEEYIDSDLIPEWFTQSVADYTSDGCDREDDIDWLMTGALGDVATVENGKLTFSSDVRRYFKRKHDVFIKAAEQLAKVEFNDFVSSHSVYSILYNLKESYNDRYGFYVYSNDELYTLDEFMRTVGDGDVYFIGGTVDYHC